MLELMPKILLTRLEAYRRSITYFMLTSVNIDEQEGVLQALRQILGKITMILNATEPNSHQIKL